MQSSQKNRRMGKTYGLHEGQRCHQKSKTEKRPGQHASYAFLNQEFKPVTDLSITNKANVLLIERSFFNSLKHLSSFYEFKAKIFRHLSYPENIVATFEHAVDMMRKKEPSIKLVITISEQSPVALSTVRELDTDLTLFYVPMDALIRLHRRKNKQAFWLLVSCYAYLHQHAGMPLCGGYSYVDDCYRMIEEAIEGRDSDFEEEELISYRRTFSYMKRCLRILNREIKKAEQVTNFSVRLQSFHPSNEMERDLFQSASKLLALFEQHPGRSLRELSSGEFLYKDVEEKGYIEQYYSFCWTLDGWLIDQLVEYANCDLQERADTERHG